MSASLGRWFRVVGPPGYLVWGVLIWWLGIEMIHALFGVPLFRLRDIACMGAAGLYGVLRVTTTHPQFDFEYLGWLSLTPWQPHKPLPKGPIHLVVQDVVLIGTIMLASAHGRTLPWEAVPLAFSSAYALVLAVSLIAIDQRWLGYATLALIGLVVRLSYDSSLVALAAALALVGPWAYGCVSVTLKTFPWTGRASQWRDSLRRSFQVFATGHKQYFNQGVNFEHPQSEVQWPFNRLHARAVPPLGREHRVAIAMLAGWWLYVIFSIPRADEAVMAALGMVYPVGVIIAAGVRLVAYSAHHHPPISFWGRIFTGRWIIPGYDVVFLTPLAALLIGAATPSLLFFTLHLPPAVVLGFSVTTVLLVLTLGGPRLANWQLTAPARIVSGGRNAQFVEEI